MTSHINKKGFPADDCLQFSDNLEQAKLNIKNLMDISKKYGLVLNKEKSNFLTFNVRDKLEEIEGIKVIDKIKYLGVTINNNKNCFREYKKEILQKAQKLANMTYSIIAKSCNKIMVGKTYWKSVALLPSLLHGSLQCDSFQQK